MDANVCRWSGRDPRPKWSESAVRRESASWYADRAFGASPCQTRGSEGVCERERERESGCVCVWVRERGCVCVSERERD
jgi:hypothetical protein